MPQAPEPPPRFMTALLSAKPDKQEELANTLKFLMAGIRSQAGCLDTLAGRDLGGTPRFILHSTWKDGPSLARFMDSEDFKVLRGASSILTDLDGFLLYTSPLPDPPPESGDPALRPRSTLLS